MPGRPNSQNYNCLPPKTPLTPGTYKNRINKNVYKHIPPNICLFTAEYIKEHFLDLQAKTFDH